MNNEQPKVNRESLVLIANLIIGGLGLFGVEIGDREGFTEAVIAGISGLIIIIVSVTYILSHVDYKKKQLETSVH